MDPDPRDDQADARSRDLTRLVELVAPHLPANHTGPVTDAFPFMTPADCNEVEAIIDRISDISEDPERIRFRREILLNLALMEPPLLTSSSAASPVSAMAR